ncbi:MAG: universal stress protein [Comamonadaceae bacterium]|nr:MAG: universal stress protein [Comamonadaceae bacterium]
MGALSSPEPTLDVLRPSLPACVQERCVVVLMDASPAAANAAWRAALLARDRAAPLHLLHVRADARGPDDTGALLRELANQLQQRLHVAASAGAVAGKPREALAGLSGRAGLVVLPAARGKLWPDLFLGSLAERIQRALPLPLLVVRRPAFSSYRRVLVPVKLDGDAVRLIAAARSVSRDPRMRVFHVLDAAQDGSIRLAGASERTVRMQQHRHTRTAYAALNELITRAGAHEQGAAALVSRGHVPTRVLEIARSGNAQLIVLGKERRSLLADLLFGGVTRRLLADADTDVLVLPVEDGSRVPERDVLGWHFDPARAPHGRS